MFKVFAIHHGLEISLADCPSIFFAESAAESFKVEYPSSSCYIIFTPTGEVVKTI